MLDELVFAKEESERSKQALELVRERDIQRTAAFWLDRLNTEREAAAARIAELQAQSNEGASETIADPTENADLRARATEAGSRRGGRRRSVSRINASIMLSESDYLIQTHRARPQKVQTKKKTSRPKNDD